MTNERLNVRSRGHENFSTEAIDFGAKDGRGRAMGTTITTFEETFDLEYDVQAGSHGAPEGVVPGRRYFVFYPHATRDGKRFGASQCTTWYSDKAVRDRAIAKYLDGARKRAAKGAK